MLPVSTPEPNARSRNATVPPLTGESDGEPCIRIGSNEGNDARNQERHRCSAAGQIHRQAENGEDAAADHAADPDGRHFPIAELILFGITQAGSAISNCLDFFEHGTVY